MLTVTQTETLMNKVHTFFTFNCLVLTFCLQGHAAPVLYAAWAEVGYVKESDLLNLRKIDCDLEGHPTPVSLYLFSFNFFFLNKKSYEFTLSYAPFSPTTRN